MTVSCEICFKTLCDKRSLKKHNKRFHPEALKKIEYECGEFGEKSLSLWDVYRHMDENNGSKLEKLCIYCKAAFASMESFVMHMEQKHGLPLWDSEAVQSVRWVHPVESAFQGR